MAKTRKKKQTLEEQLLRLEEILDTLDSGEEALETMIKLYEEGTTLVKDARTSLDAAEQKITTIRETLEAEEEDTDQ